MGLIVADIADEKFAASFVNGGGVGGGAAQGGGCEPRIDEAIEIGILIDRIAANLPVGIGQLRRVLTLTDWPSCWWA